MPDPLNRSGNVPAARAIVPRLDGESERLPSLSPRGDVRRLNQLRSDQVRDPEIDARIAADGLVARTAAHLALTLPEQQLG